MCILHVEMPEPSFEEIEHTADWAIRVRARDLPELFATAARGMFSLLADLSTVPAARQFEIDLGAIDAETLLIDWLNELLYLAEEHQLIFASFTIHEIGGNGPVRLRATAGGGAPDELLKTIKAATFSSLSIERDGERYQAELVFDV